MTAALSQPLPHRAGDVALVGRPNVGKSTLLNTLVGNKVAIVTPRAQTTRQRVAGIRTLPQAQIVFLDTPGMHEARSLLNRRMVEVARRTLTEADAVVVVVDATAGIRAEDRSLIERALGDAKPLLVALNKIDRMPKPALLPLLAELGELAPRRDIVPVSALHATGVDLLLHAIVRLLPPGPRLYGEDEFTTASERFLVAELIREQLFLALREEVPYGTAVVIDRFEDRPDRPVTVVCATILVTRASHKPIVLGTGGLRLRAIGSRARRALEHLLARNVFLELFVRVEPDWTCDPRRLQELGL